MTKQEEIILDAIERANKLGAKGIEVTGYAESGCTTQSPQLMLVTRMPRARTASEKAWYD